MADNGKQALVARATAETPAEVARRNRQYLDGRINSLSEYRESWREHWQELAEYLLPTRYRWLYGKNNNPTERGRPVNNRILNNTGTLCVRNMAAGIMAGVSSPTRPWFQLTVADDDTAMDPEVQDWLGEVAARMMRVMAGSGYYNAKAMQYVDLALFGTAPMIIYTDPKNMIRFYNPTAGEYFCATGPNFNVTVLGREFEMTAMQMKAEFGEENLSVSAQAALRLPDGLDRTFTVRHLVEPNPDHDPTPVSVGSMNVPRHFPYREVFWEKSADEAKLLRSSGFYEMPFSCPRWDVAGNDAYGRSPAMDALGDIKQLQFEERRKAQALDKYVNPPMVADYSLKQQAASLLPGAVNFIPGMDANKAGFRPAYQVLQPGQELTESIQTIEKRIRDTFYIDLFLTITNLDTVRSAAEVAARREEKLLMLGPVIERNQAEGLTPDINRIFQIMYRGGALPPLPEAMKGQPVRVEYVSAFADLQKNSALTGIERLLQFAGGLNGAMPGVLDLIDGDETVRTYARTLRVPPKIIATKQQLDAKRQQRQQAQQQEQAMQQGSSLVDGAKVLSETDVGGGQNALAMMLGNPGAPAQ